MDDPPYFSSFFHWQSREVKNFFSVPAISLWSLSRFCAILVMAKTSSGLAWFGRLLFYQISRPLPFYFCFFFRSSLSLYGVSASCCVGSLREKLFSWRCNNDSKEGFPRKYMREFQRLCGAIPKPSFDC